MPRKYYRGVIKHDAEEIRRLSKNHVSVSAGSEGINYNYHAASQQQQEIKIQVDVILDLAETLRTTGEIPQLSRTRLSRSPSPSPSNSAASSRTSDSRTNDGEQSVPQPDGPPMIPRLPSVSSLHVLPSRSELSHGHARSASSTLSRAGSEPRPSRAPVVPRSPSIRSEDDFIGVHSGEGLRIVTSPEKRIEQGHIRHKDGDKIAVIAKIKPKQAFNFMTTIRASELGLLDCVQPHGDDDEETWIMLPSGKRIRPDGTIQLRWYPRQSRSVSLQLFVLSGWWEREIVLGEQYIAKEEHYAKRRRDGKI